MHTKLTRQSAHASLGRTSQENVFQLPPKMKYSHAPYLFKTCDPAYHPALRPPIESAQSCPAAAAKQCRRRDSTHNQLRRLECFPAPSLSSLAPPSCGPSCGAFGGAGGGAGIAFERGFGAGGAFEVVARVPPSPLLSLPRLACPCTTIAPTGVKSSSSDMTKTFSNESSPL